jgi:hypothetical protein
MIKHCYKNKEGYKERGIDESTKMRDEESDPRKSDGK